MRNIIGNGGLQSVGLVAGSVTDYAALPTPASAYTGQFWFVRTGSGGFWTAFNSYKYPVGLYFPTTSNTWQLAPFNVNVAEDASTLVNITDWTSYFAYVTDIGAGDMIIYDSVRYTNDTGALSATAPDSDATNWTSV